MSELFGIPQGASRALHQPRDRQRHHAGCQCPAKGRDCERQQSMANTR